MKNKNSKYLWISMISTIYILALLTGFTIVEKNAQDIISSDSQQFLSYTLKNNFFLESLKIHFMGKNIVFNF